MHILPDTTFQVEELAPGSRLFVWPTPRLKTVTVRLFFLSPLDGETTGRALVASVLGRGSRKFPTTRKIICFLQNLYGASLSLGVSKMGERHLLEASVELLADRYTARRGGILSRGIRFLREMLLRPLREGNGLRATYVDQEKRNLRRFLESLINDKAEYAAERHIEEMCRDEPFGQPAHGRIGEIDRWDPKNLLELAGRLWGRHLLEVVAVGDFRPERLRKEIERNFPRTTNSVLAIPPVEPANVPEKVRHVVEEKDVDQAQLVLGYRTATTLGDPAVYPMLFVNGILGGFAHSRLFREVREKAALAYAIGSSVNLTKGLLVVQAGIDAASAGRVEGMVEKAVSALCQGDISLDEMDKTRLALEHAILAAQDYPASLAYWALERTMHGARLSLREEHEGIRSVRRDEVAEAARRLRLDTVYLLRPCGRVVPERSSG